MLLLEYFLLLAGWGLLAVAAVHLFRNIYKVVQYHRRLRRMAPSEEAASTHAVLPEPPQLSWTTAQRAFLAAWLPLILAAGIVVVPSGMGGIRASQAAGTLPGTL